MPMKKMNYSFSRIIRTMSVILSVVLLLHFCVIIYAMRRLTDNSLQSVSDLLRMDVKNLENQLSSIQDRMLTENGYDTNLDKLLNLQKDSIEMVSITKSLKNILMNFSTDYPYSINYAIYYPEQDIYVNDCFSTAEYDLFREVGGDLFAYANGDKVSAGWQVRELAGEYYVTNYIYNNQRYIICYISLHEILKSFGNTVYGEQYYITAADSTGRIFYFEDRLADENIDLFTDKSLTQKPGLLDNYMIVKQSADEFMDVYLIIFDFNNVLKIFSEQLVSGIFLAIFVGIDIWFLLFVYRTVVKPIESFNQNIKGLKTNELYTVETHYKINELGNASELMADMVSKIKGLKIDIYEKTLEQQKMQMDFLTLQIQPHFYLNCLNIIYNMCQTGDYEEIQQLTSYVSDYLRYIFKSGNQMVFLCEELEHVKRYLEIQKIRYREGFTFTMTADEDVLSARLPPLIVQTFIENAIKHTVTRERDIALSLSVKKTLVKDKPYLVIVIEDTGTGFDEKILRNLQNHENISAGDKRIGIMNAVSRLHYTFGDDASVHFYNKPESDAGLGGAGIRITCPYTETDPETSLVLPKFI